jgi:hypothetical protein
MYTRFCRHPFSPMKKGVGKKNVDCYSFFCCKLGIEWFQAANVDGFSELAAVPLLCTAVIVKGPLVG